VGFIGWRFLLLAGEAHFHLRECMNGLVTTRIFQSDDLRALYAIEDACFEASVRFSRGLMRRLAGDEACRTWLGIVDGVRVGFAIVGVSGKDDLVEAGSAYLWTIEVLPAFRRMGVAGALLRRVEESAADAGCLAVELHVAEENGGALGLYERAGFERVGVVKEYYGRGKDGFHLRKSVLRS